MKTLDYFSVDALDEYHWLGVYVTIYIKFSVFCTDEKFSNFDHCKRIMSISDNFEVQWNNDKSFYIVEIINHFWKMS